MRLKLLLLASLLLSAAILAHTFLSPDGWPRRERVRRDLERVEAEVTRAEQRARKLRAQIDALRTRPEVQERIVRDELGYVREGDVVLELPRTSR